MEDRETPRMRKYGESKTTRIMTANVRQVTSSLGLRTFQADGFLFDGVYVPDTGRHLFSVRSVAEHGNSVIIKC
jgi:hypothetical protein